MADYPEIFGTNMTNYISNIYAKNHDCTITFIFSPWWHQSLVIYLEIGECMTKSGSWWLTLKNNESCYDANTFWSMVAHKVVVVATYGAVSDDKVGIMANLVIYWNGFCTISDSNVHGANMGPTWVLSAPDGPHVGPINLAIRDVFCK